MGEAGIPFAHSTPTLYDRCMAPLLFEPYAKILAERAALLQPARILETAAGTGIATRALHHALPHAEILATDVNPVMLDMAARRLRSDRVSFQPADAQHLAFDDDSFDLVVCQFGVMFFPDRVRAHTEARRVLRSGGHYLLASFDQLDRNPVPKAAGDAVAALFAFPIPLRTWNVALSVTPMRGSSSATCARPGSLTSSWRRSSRRAGSTHAMPLGDRARLALPRGDRATRSFCSGSCTRRRGCCTGPVGRRRRTHVRACGHRHQVKRRLVPARGEVR